MRHLNYNHLLYFWTVAREGSIAKASEVLHLTPQTISGQLKLLDEAVGERLFQRVGRRLVLSDTGQFVFQYADEIFTLGAELTQVVRGKREPSPLVLKVGVTDSIPKLVAQRTIQPALHLEEPLRVVCQEGSLESLLGELAVHRLDVVLSDRRLPTGLSVQAYNHPLGDSGVSFFAPRGQARRYRKGFPGSLHEAPMLLPAASSALRRSLEDWFESHSISPTVVAEFDDSALLKAFGQAGEGLFAAPTAIENEICRMYRMSVVGHTEEVREHFFVISPERRLRHPAVLAIQERARKQIFSPGPALAEAAST